MVLLPSCTLLTPPPTANCNTASLHCPALSITSISLFILFLYS
ncbi:hypothetical protein E2C01_102868 [Portunus trituberculatus]|uniref:Uncharacterized protein n=1 Tax=Portunus trituberculatus TaxID=210409 RepID=A0A5B7KNJ5_PORTR|nr:hypothetical protein [Portunus trituberculatus]